MQVITIALLAFAAASTPLVPASSTQDPQGDEPFLPAIDFATRSPEAWLAAFEGSGGESRDALWALFHSYRESVAPAATISVLRDWMERRMSVEVKRDIETILTQWSVAYTLPSAPRGEPVEPSFDVDEAEVFRSMGVDKETLFITPSPDDAATLEELREELKSEDMRFQATAAIELGRRRADVSEVVNTLFVAMHEAGNPDFRSGNTLLLTFNNESRIAVPLESARSFALSQVIRDAGDEAVNAMLELVCDAPRDLALRRAAFRILTDTHRADAATWLSLLERHKFPFDELGPELDEKLLFCLPDADESAKPAAAESPMRARLLQRWTNESPNLALVELSGEAGLRCSNLRGDLRPHLTALLDDGKPLEVIALHWLTQWGESSPEIRAAYVRALKTIDPQSVVDLRRLPLLEEHDEESLAALRRLFNSSPDKSPFLRPLGVAKLVDGENELMARAYLESLPTNEKEPWRAAFNQGFAANLPLAPQADPVVRCLRTGIRLRALRSAGQDFENERRMLLELLPERDPASQYGDPAWSALYVLNKLELVDDTVIDWALDTLMDSWATTWDLHTAAANALAKVELSAAQRARLYRMDLLSDSSATHYELLARQGASALEWAGTIRTLAENGAPSRLNYALRIARFSPRDEQILVAALDDADVHVREQALDVIEEHHLDSPALRNAIAKLRDDPHGRLARRAQLLAKAK